MPNAQHQGSGFQEKFVHEDAVRFRAATKMAQAAGTLLGKKLGQSAQEATAVGDVLLRADLTEPGEGDLHLTMKEVAERSDVSLSDPEIAGIIQQARIQTAHPTVHSDTHTQP